MTKPLQLLIETRETNFYYRRGRIYWKHARRLIARARQAGRGLGQFFHRASASSLRARGRTRISNWSRATTSICRAHRGDERLRHRVPSRGQRRCAVRAGTSAQRSRTKHHRHFQRPRSDARDRRESHRVLFDRQRLWRSGSDSHAGGPRVPHPDFALRRIQTRGRGTDSRLLRRLSAWKVTSSASFRFSASATRTATFSISTSNSSNTPTI